VEVEGEVVQRTGEEGEGMGEPGTGGEGVPGLDTSGEGAGGLGGEGSVGPTPRRRRRKGAEPVSPALVPYQQRNAGFEVREANMRPYRSPPREKRSLERLVATRKAWETDGRLQAQNYKAMEKRRQRQREEALPAIASVKSLQSASVDSSHSVLAMQAAAKKKGKDTQKSRYGEKLLGEDGINRVRFSFYVKNDEIVERALLTTQSRKVEKLDQHINKIERNLNFIKQSRLREYTLLQNINGRELDQLTMQELQQHPIDKDLQYSKSLMSKEVAKFERKRNHLEWVARRRLAHTNQGGEESGLNLPRLKPTRSVPSPRVRQEPPSQRAEQGEGEEEDALDGLVAGGGDEGQGANSAGGDEEPAVESQGGQEGEVGGADEGAAEAPAPAEEEPPAVE